MSALKRKTREMLAVHRARKPPAATGTAIGDTIAKLRTDLESHHQRAAEINRLIGMLVAYGGTEKSPPATLPVTAPVRRRRAGGRPVIDPGDAVRAQRAAAMRQRRARLKSAAAAAPPTKPKSRKKEKKPPPPPRRARRKPRRLPPMHRRPPTVTSSAGDANPSSSRAARRAR